MPKFAFINDTQYQIVEGETILSFVSRYFWEGSYTNAMPY